MAPAAPEARVTRQPATGAAFLARPRARTGAPGSGRAAIAADRLVAGGRLTNRAGCWRSRSAPDRQQQPEQSDSEQRQRARFGYRGAVQEDSGRHFARVDAQSTGERERVRSKRRIRSEERRVGKEW